ncbi:hypothetical protein EHR_01890 [Enterococcus hirae ATCC 9790]|uniref:Amino acid ABC transporter permease n=1 Tax=Enterococcus hirae (strain ATCC 9790 / DSM 20160 / JCM 8729 / LMG 6399 / NBRC 3181 / NCIMB 6459 / NCDO 1258 / NCTC 12367 / WDCM 00089 / R) TaxID=768486 RepID=I6SVE5_ENTHA|nr:hypothetical protein EHR_01890 [Enterococcus hirae ATCC 9790]
MDKSFAETYLDFSQINMETMKQAFIDTLYMTLVSMVLVTIIGLVLGLILYSIGRKINLMHESFMALFRLLVISFDLRHL